MRLQAARMLYSQRQAYERMGRWRPVHRLLWTLYWPVSRFRVMRFIWRQYRRTWPTTGLSIRVAVQGAAEFEAALARLSARFEAWPPGTAVTAPPVPEATPEDSTRRQVHHYVSASGAEGWYSYDPDRPLSTFALWTGAGAPDASSTSTPTPSSASRLLIEESSQWR